MEVEVWRAGSLRRAPAEGPGRREPQAEEAASGSDARQRHVEGPQRKKMVTPVVKRQAVTHLCQAYEVSQRRACQVVKADRTSMRYRSGRPEDAALRVRLRELAAVSGSGTTSL